MWHLKHCAPFCSKINWKSWQPSKFSIFWVLYSFLSASKIIHSFREPHGSLICSQKSTTRLFWTRWIQSMSSYSHKPFLDNALLIFSHSYLRFPKWFPSKFSEKNYIYTLSPPHTHYLSYPYHPWFVWGNHVCFNSATAVSNERDVWCCIISLLEHESVTEYFHLEVYKRCLCYSLYNKEMLQKIVIWKAFHFDQCKYIFIWMSD